jgi:hypothetical protein
MEGAAISRDLFGENYPGAECYPEEAKKAGLPLPIHPAVEMRQALLVLGPIYSAVCDGIRVECDGPIRALCGAMWASGVTDSAMQVVDEAGKAVCFVESIYEMAKIGSMKP